MQEKLERLAALIEKESIERRKADGVGCQANIDRCKASIKPGKKYTRVDVGDRGKYMVVNETGEIFGIKAYGVIHKGHRFGTLDEIEQWNWGGYRAELKSRP